MRTCLIVASLLCLAPIAASAGELAGPARFCGYSPVIDLLEGEKIETLQGGIHGGSFRWHGAFGILDVEGIGWARRPKGRIVATVRDDEPARFAQRRTADGYEMAIWNGAHGAAYFRSASPFTREQLNAIARVRLFEEGQEPEGCALRTVFVWE
ncbi:hypothetical protein I5E68_08790 [Novosphingobium sp. YJ-S2-02]|uniref:DUF3237 domain-containing protein n=1 Tax=Novosphingobium aureum TaxID=2792964 RepID=A0A931HCN1_9SPHN|nr:hypothetical protein [Novosphingobium aureum]MBH0113043.1 hypothetical protein [Novosphingobium aureum]